MAQPKIILLFSGKRKCGKDFLCEKLKATIGENKCNLIRISGPLKQLYATNHNLIWDKLMSSDLYKEKYRQDMINWSDDIRRKDPGYFCKAACKSAPQKDIWIVSDIRRKSDIKWFKDNYSSIKIIRIYADLEVRKARGWIFTSGVDDVVSECDLDDFSPWDMEFANNNNLEYKKTIEEIVNILPL
ncbi:phosphomevalonate kinase [Euwallacea similis]|uniref:phosphomevalonate kinase n=1 Tax=Euwallacea similis TaxID=1736056 RepID=UPI00344C2DD1